jgi:hypothetical protein
MIHARTFTTELHCRTDDRLITGTLLPYNTPTTVTEYGKTYVEDFAVGARSQPTSTARTRWS